MYNARITVATTVALSLVIVLFYYNVFNLIQPYSNMYPRELHTKAAIYLKNTFMKPSDAEEFLIDTPGCAIPNYMKFLDFKEANPINKTCNDRMVFVDKVSENKISFRINSRRIMQKKAQSFKCAYRFALRSNVSGKADKKLIYTKFKPFKNGDIVKLEEEVIEVLCNLSISKKITTYNDAYLILKKMSTYNFSAQFENNNISSYEKWNVLIMGMDTMSRARAYHSIPNTVKYLKENGWLDYKGYQKIGENTFPNVMAVLSGKNSSSAWSDCRHGMDQCENSLIWNKFKKAGYMTAFGEDNLMLPDTFSVGEGFTEPPTDHYARPLFLLGEYTRGNILCTGGKSSAQHLLEYALQFSQAYKSHRFFGHFWINSHSHNLRSLPGLFQEDLITFFESLKSNGSLDNTFIFFVSDHGIRFGPQRISRESYYEERLPMLFMWVPIEFRKTYPLEYKNLQHNQFRLTTPYDLYATLCYLVSKSSDNVDSVAPEACPQCTSLTSLKSVERTCADAHVDMKWCSCHRMTEAHQDDHAAKRSLDLAVQYIQHRANTTKTSKCTMCSPILLDKVLRSDWYRYGYKKYYVIAFRMKPGNVLFEATIETEGDDYKILQPTSTISSYNIRGSCTVNKYDRQYCVCIKIMKCTN